MSFLYSIQQPIQKKNLIGERDLKNDKVLRHSLDLNNNL